MYACDFEYDGKMLSDFGMVVGSFQSGSSDGAGGSEIKFNLVPAQYGRRFYAAGLQYEDCLGATFQICKNPEVFREEDLTVTNEEFRALSRWLNRKEFLWFRSFDAGEPEVVKPWFRASFTLKRIESGLETFGVELKMVTDAPFGYGDEVKETLSFTAANQTKTLYDRNEEMGDSYPELTVTCGAAGTLTLTNAMTGCMTQIKNCRSGEVLRLSGESMIASSSVSAHDIANDFNYDFFSIGNTADGNANSITASLPCTAVIRYRPVWKDTI